MKKSFKKSKVSKEFLITVIICLVLFLGVLGKMIAIQDYTNENLNDSNSKLFSTLEIVSSVCLTQNNKKGAKNE